MSEVIFKEEGFEQVFVNKIKELGYYYVSSNEIGRSSLKSPIINKVLEESLARINPDIPYEVIEKAIRQISHIDAGLLEARNETFFDYLQNGISIAYHENDEQKTAIVYLIDYENVDNNSFIVTNQFRMVGRDSKRPDVVIFVNGMPLVVIELKSASTEQADIWSAYRQIKNYQYDIEELFVYNAFNVISDFTQTKVGTITSNESWYKDWKTTDGSYESTKAADYNTLLEGILDKHRFLDIVKNFIVFEHKDRSIVKIMAQYHQYFAVHKAIVSTLNARETGSGRGGVFWHTQGSGKSLSMVFYTHLMGKRLNKATFVIITDRNELDDQLYGQFSRVEKFLRQMPVQAKSRADLKELLNGRVSNGIFFTTMQKFAESEEALTDRDDVIVIADEAHRSQYGLREKLTRDGKKQIGMARLIRQSLPHATYIGFTGTPLSESDKDTKEVFGNYIDIYDMSQSVKDGATKPIYYENRVVNLKLNERVLTEIDEKYNELAQIADEVNIEKSKRELSHMYTLLGSEQTIDILVKDIVSHYEQNREHVLTGKAMIVAYNREIGLKIYKKILELRPNWNEKVKVVMTGSNNDPEEWKSIIGSKSDREELAKKFKDNDDPMKIAIVVDMWLTGFDVPSLATMYVYKPMKGHNLMQAIARVNRVFKEKEGGLIVDYIGIGNALKEAMSNYTKNDQTAIDTANIRASAYPKFEEKLETCHNLYLNRLDYSPIFSEHVTEMQRADLIQEGINHILQFSENIQKDFKKDAYALKQAHTLCSSITSEQQQREAAFIEAIRISLNRLSNTDQKLSKLEINDQINELLQQTIQSDGVINLFQDFENGFSLFDPNFLDKISKMTQKNLSIELLNKVLSNEIRVISRMNVVKGEQFSEKLKRIMKKYRDGLVDNAAALDQFTGLSDVVSEEGTDYEAGSLSETRQKLIDLAKETVRSENAHERLGLSRAEMAFYNAIADSKNVQDFYTDEELINITKELTEIIANEMTPDWYMKQSGRANVKRMIKRLLRKYHYPDDINKVMPLVLKQAEYWDVSRTDTERQRA